MRPLWLLALAAPATAGEPVGEVELVRLALHASLVGAELDALRAQGDAAATSTLAVPNPTLDARREQGGGPDGPSLDALGGSITLDLGLSGLAELRAAGLRGEAGQAWLRAGTVAAVCEVRGGVLEAWLAAERVASSHVAEARLVELEQAVAALARTGDRSDYEHQRIELVVAAHAGQVAADVADEATSGASLDALAGVAIGQVELLPLGELGDLGASLANAWANDPVRAALQHELRAAEHALAAARRGSLPDLTVSGAARWETLEPGTTSQGYELGAGLEVPLFDRGQAERAEQRASLAQLQARLVQRETSLRTQVEASWHVATGLDALPVLPDTEGIWQGARQRYMAGEADLDELLAVATDIAAAERARLDAEALRRSSRLQLACLAGTFDHPELQALVEEQNR